jgi:hypothetical protein
VLWLAGDGWAFLGAAGKTALFDRLALGVDAEHGARANRLERRCNRNRPQKASPTGAGSTPPSRRSPRSGSPWRPRDARLFRGSSR